MKRIIALCVAFMLCLGILAGCSEAGEPAESGKTIESDDGARKPDSDEGSSNTESDDGGSKTEFADGTYTATFTTDSSMFHINETLEDKCTVTVKDGKATAHITLVSKSIVNLYPGFAEDAQKEGAELLQPTTDTVTYKDGTTEEVYGFDIPVPVFDEEFDLAIVGTKGKWYDHKVKITDMEPVK
ncbi:MAG: hypothetical protein IJM62_05290 [Lachnospiraceae bacterium]|nr:hypothetical protein [Lachnospiraceae bacterium]